MNKLLKNFITNTLYRNRIIFDGYPRNITQAENLEVMLNGDNQSINFILFLKVNREIIEKRILGRITCEKCNKTFNEFFIDSVKCLNINGNVDIITNVGNLSDPIAIALKKFECHPSIIDIIEKVEVSSKFSFHEVIYSDIESEIKNFDLNPNLEISYRESLVNPGQRILLGHFL